MGVFTRHNRSVPPKAVRASASLPAPHSLDSYTPAEPLPYSVFRPLTASARRYRLDNREDIEALVQLRNAETWQKDAWEYFDAIGEIKYAFTMVANISSRIRLYAARVDDPSLAPTPCSTVGSVSDTAAIKAVSRFDTASGGQAGFLRDATLNLSVVGEFNLVQQPANPFEKTPETWNVRSNDELTVDTGSKTITISTSRTPSIFKKPIRLPANAFAARIWRPHPRYSDEADSSMIGILDLCSELLLLNRAFRSTARSRLNSGMLYLPDGLKIASNPDLVDPSLLGDFDAEAEAAAVTEEDEFENALMDAMLTPITDESSAAAVLPLILRGPAELAEKIKQFKFERSFDPSLAERADRVLDRIMQGIDVPKDIVTGLANIKYANAVQIDESLYKAHIEPLILFICDALTMVYLRPALIAAGVDKADADKYVVWYDPSNVTTRTDRADDADKGLEKYALSYQTWRRTHGFADEDAPDATELALRLMIDRGSFTPELTESLLQVFLPDIMDRVRQATMAQSPVPLDPAVAEALAGETPGASDEPPAPPADEPAVPEAEPASEPNVAPQSQDLPRDVIDALRPPAT